MSPIGWPRSKPYVSAPTPTMNRLLNVLWMLMLFELGVLLIVLPWLGHLWDTNYFLSHYPLLRPFLLNPSVRGSVSGLGALNIFSAAILGRRRNRAPKLGSPKVSSSRAWRP